VNITKPPPAWRFLIRFGSSSLVLVTFFLLRTDYALQKGFAHELCLVRKGPLSFIYCPLGDKTNNDAVQNIGLIHWIKGPKNPLLSSPLETVSEKTHVFLVISLHFSYVSILKILVECPPYEKKDIEKGPFLCEKGKVSVDEYFDELLGILDSRGFFLAVIEQVIDALFGQVRY